MTGTLLDPLNQLHFEESFRSLMTDCEISDSEAAGAGAFEVKHRRMLGWLERNGPERAQDTEDFLRRLISGLDRRKGGTVWSGELDFNHTWTAAEARDYFCAWRNELTRAVELFDAKSLVLLSLAQRSDQTGRYGRNFLGDYSVAPLTEREFGVLEDGDAVRDGSQWICLTAKQRNDSRSPLATIWFLKFACGRCGRDLKIGQDEEGPDVWRISCCGSIAHAERVFDLARKWMSISQRIGIPG